MRYPDFAERIKKAMDHANMEGSQREIAKRMGVSASTINNWLTGEKLPSHKTAIQVARQLGVSLVWLMSGDGPMVQEESVEARLSRLPPEAREVFMSTLEALESKYAPSSSASTPSKKL